MASLSSHNSSVDAGLKRKCPSHKLRDLRRSCVFILEKQTKENIIIKEENLQHFNENTILKREISILEVDNTNLNQENANLERKFNKLQQEKLCIIEKSNATLEQDKNTSLAAQKERYVARHDQIILKLTERYQLILADSVKPLEDKIQSISRENQTLKKKVSLFEREQHLFETEKKRPAVSFSLKGVQKEPMDLSSGETQKSISWTIPGD